MSSFLNNLDKENNENIKNLFKSQKIQKAEFEKFLVQNNNSNLKSKSNKILKEQFLEINKIKYKDDINKELNSNLDNYELQNLNFEDNLIYDINKIINNKNNLLTFYNIDQLEKLNNELKNKIN